jgi:hypothetical protein
MFGVCLDQMQTAFEATPAGAKQAAIRHKEEAKAAAEQAERNATKRSLAEMDALGKQLQDYNDKAERCFTSWGHQLPALTDAVKNGLHNPHAFEHVKTVLTVADADSNNVEMTFRAENGFGALRTARVKAQLVADGCVVQNIRDPEIE